MTVEETMTAAEAARNAAGTAQAAAEERIGSASASSCRFIPRAVQESSDRILYIILGVEAIRQSDP